MRISEVDITIYRDIPDFGLSDPSVFFVEKYSFHFLYLTRLLRFCYIVMSQRGKILCVFSY